jgi:hypothetical protein
MTNNERHERRGNSVLQAHRSYVTVLLLIAVSRMGKRAMSASCVVSAAIYANQNSLFPV